MCLHGFIYYKAMQLFVCLSNKAQFNHRYILFPVLSFLGLCYFSPFSLPRIIWTGSILATQLCHYAICKTDHHATLQIREDENTLFNKTPRLLLLISTVLKYEHDQQIPSTSEQCNGRMEGDWKARSAYPWVSQHPIGLSWLSWRGDGPLLLQTVCDTGLCLMYIVSILYIGNNCLVSAILDDSTGINTWETFTLIYLEIFTIQVFFLNYYDVIFLPN